MVVRGSGGCGRTEIVLPENLRNGHSRFVLFEQRDDLLLSKSSLRAGTFLLLKRILAHSGAFFRGYV